MPVCAEFIFHKTLNDFLPKSQRNCAISYFFSGNPGIKDAIEALGVPHPEVAAIQVNGKSVSFQYQLRAEDKVEVFPKNGLAPEGGDILLLPAVPDSPGFVLDVHLGKLAKALRMLGFDAVYSNDFTDKEIAELALAENRIILTRDVNLLKIKTIKLGYWLRSQHLEEQLTEVVRYFQLHKFAPFTRCLECNGLIVPVEKQEVLNQLPPNTKKYFHEFYQCENCRKVYWKGSHFERMQDFIKRFQNN